MADNVKGEADGPSDISACDEDCEMTENNRQQKNIKKKKNSMKALKKTFQRVGEISPLKNKEPITKLEKTNNGNDLGNSSEDPIQSPTSPSKYYI